MSDQEHSKYTTFHIKTLNFQIIFTLGIVEWNIFSRFVYTEIIRDMKTVIDILKEAQKQELESGFPNGNLWNDLEDQINIILIEQRNNSILSLNSCEEGIYVVG